MATENLRRLLNLYGVLLQAGATRTALTRAEIAKRLAGQGDDYTGASGKRMFSRDRGDLAEADIPVTQTHDTSTPGAPGWYIPHDQWFWPGVALTGDERDALARALRMVDFREVLWGTLATTKLGVRAPADIEPMAVLAAPPALPGLQAAHSTRAPVTFRYHDKERTLDPYGVAVSRGHWYVVGHAHGADAIRVFRVDRITDNEVSIGDPDSFEVPDGFDIDEHVPTDLFDWGAETYDVVVAVDAAVAAIVSRDVHEGLTTTERDDGRVELRFSCTHVETFLSWALSLGNRLEVLAPPPLRQAMIDRLRALADSETPVGEGVPDAS